MGPTGLEKTNRNRSRRDSDAVTRQGLSTQEFSRLNSGDTVRKPMRASARDKRRKLVLYFALALVFVRLSMIHQLLEYLLHHDTYLLYLVAFPVIAGIPLTGGLRRAFRYRSTWCWTGFALWLIPTSLFSTWKTGSLPILTGYYKSEFVLLFAIAGLVTTWQECRWLLYTICAAALVNIASVLMFRELDETGRTRLIFGTVRNSNDYSAHLVFVLPFLLWVILIAKPKWLRITGVLVLALAAFEILAAGSRGGMIGLATAVFLFVLTTPPRIRRVVLVGAPVVAMLIIALLPPSVTHRIFAFSSNDAEASSEAVESAQDREHLLKDSISATIRHPLFGLGPGQFINIEGQSTAESGHRLWNEAHNSFTQIASENGFPGLFFLLGGVLSSFFLINNTGRFLRGKNGTREAAAAVVCLRIALISFCITIFFLNFGYYFYLPTLAGIAIALAASSRQLITSIKQGARG
jgi:O-antigen ligase